MRPYRLASLIPLVLISTLCGCSRGHPEAELLIGEVESLGGSEAAFGTSTHRGVELAVDELNAAGGITSVGGAGGKKLRVIVVDDQGKADESALAATKLITEDQVVALLGGGASTRLLAMAPIAQSHRVPLLATGATNPKVTTIGDHVFRICFIDPFQGKVMAGFARRDLKLKTVAILRDVKSDYSVGLSDTFSTAFKAAGGEIVADQSYSSGDADFHSQLTSLLARKPGAIFIPGSYTDVALIGRQARELGARAQLLGGDGWDSPKLKEIAGAALAGGFFSSQYSPESTDPRVREFVAAFRKRYGMAPDASAALGYDGIHALAKAARAASIREGLAALKGFAGVTGEVAIDEHRDAIKSAVVIRVDERGDFRFYAVVRP